MFHYVLAKSSKFANTAAGRFKRIMAVALARTLVIALWWFLETGLVPDGGILNA